MGVLAEIVQAMHADSEPVVTYENIHETALQLTQTNRALHDMVKEKCKASMDASRESDNTKLMCRAAIEIILPYLEDLNGKRGTPNALDFEGPLVNAFLDADDELLARSYNTMMLDGDWEMVQDGVTDPEFEDHRGGRPGWLVRGVERMSPTVAIENLMVSYLFVINLWLERFTKALYANTTTEEWARIYGVNMADEQAVAHMTLRLRQILMSVD